MYKYENIELNNPTTIEAYSIGGSSSDQITSVSATSDGGYIAGGYFSSSSITVGDYILTSAGGQDGMVIKYEADGEVEWATSIGGTSSDYIQSVSATSDGGYIVGGYFSSSSITVGDYTLINARSGYSDGMVIKYGKEGKVEWATNIGGNSDDLIKSVVESSDEGYIVVGYFESSNITVGDYNLINNSSKTSSSDGFDGMVIKYSKEGIVEWATSIGGSSDDQILSVSTTSNGEILVGGYFYSSSITVGDYTLNNSRATTSSDAMLIKYNADGEVEWATSIGGSYSDQITSVAVGSDGGILVSGIFQRGITVGDYTLKNAGVIKYDAKGEVEWATSIGGNAGEYIYSLVATSDEGIIVGGCFSSGSVTVGNYIINNNSSSTSSYDGMVIKYGKEGKVEWAKNIGGDNWDYIVSVTELNDGSIIAGGYYQSSIIETDGHTLTNNSSSTSNYDGMILKIANQVGAPEVQELTVENSRKVFNITTDVNEIDGVKGGIISGEDRNPYEEVK